MISYSSYHNNLTKAILSIKEGDIDQLREEFEIKDIDVNTVVNGRYFLHYAAEFGNEEVLQYLLSLNANVNVFDDYGITPLLSAIYEGNTKCVELLLGMGASYTHSTPDDKTYEEAADKEEIRQLLQRQKLIDEKIGRVV